MQTAAMWEIMRSGGPVMWPLLACSVIVLTIIIERALFWLGIARRRNRPLRDEVLLLAQRGEWEQIEEKTANCADPVVRVLAADREADVAVHAGAGHHDHGRADARHPRHRDRHHLRISAFKMLGASSTPDPKLVTGGIAEALITTAAGLIISIATVFPYNYFRSRVEHAIHFMEKYATRLEVGWRKTRAEEQAK